MPKNKITITFDVDDLVAMLRKDFGLNRNIQELEKAMAELMEEQGRQIENCCIDACMDIILDTLDENIDYLKRL